MLELTEGFILMAIAVGNMTENRHKVSKKKNKFCIFTTYLSTPIGEVPEALFPLLEAVLPC